MWRAGGRNVAPVRFVWNLKAAHECGVLRRDARGAFVRIAKGLGVSMGADVSIGVGVWAWA